VDFLHGFGAERDFAVWQSIAQSLRSIGRLVDGEAHAALRARVRDLVGPALDDIGWEPRPDEGDLRSKLRGLLVTVLAVNGDDRGTQDRCRSIFLEQLRSDTPGTTKFHPELIAAATTVVAATGDRSDYDLLRARYLSSDNPQEQLRCLYALCEFDDPDSIRETCEFAMSSAVKSQNAPFVLARCIAARRSGHVAWEYVKANWAVATSVFPSNTIVRMVDPVKYLNTPELLADAQQFFSAHPIPQAVKTLQQILERHEVNTRLRSREETRLGAYLLDPRSDPARNTGSTRLKRLLPGNR
jgi:puromycin-sensitive aminopeptidase